MDLTQKDLLYGTVSQRQRNVLNSDKYYYSLEESKAIFNKKRFLE